MTVDWMGKGSRLSAGYLTVLLIAMPGKRQRGFVVSNGDVRGVPEREAVEINPADVKC